MSVQLRTTMELADGADSVASTVRFRSQSRNVDLHQAEHDPEHHLELILSKPEWQALGSPSSIAIAVDAVAVDNDPIG